LFALFFVPGEAHVKSAVVLVAIDPEGPFVIDIGERPTLVP
jgi:hypothetical protein